MSSETSADRTASLIHWSLYGRRGNPPTQRATPDDRTTHAFQQPATAPWDQVIPRGEVRKLLQGFTPEEMEDKWFVYATGPDAQGNAALHLHRSWTGYKMVEARFVVGVGEDGEVVDGDARFTEVVWETDRERYNGDMDAPGTVLDVCEWCMHCQLRDGASRKSEAP